MLGKKKQKELEERVEALEVKVSVLENHIEIVRDLAAPRRPKKTYKSNVTSGPNLPTDRV